MSDAKPDPATIAKNVLVALDAATPPVSVFTLSLAYQKQTGVSIKEHHKRGLLHFVKARLSNELVVSGEGNDSIVERATPMARTLQWLRECVQKNGPLLVSMVGRMYREHHDAQFTDDFPGQGLASFLHKHFEKEFNFQKSKGQEQLVSIRPKPSVKGDGSSVPSCMLQKRLSARPRATPYTSSDAILVLGDADLSWARAVADSFGDKPERGRLIVATTYESREEIVEKYGSSKVMANIRALQRANATVAHGVDATSLDCASLLPEGSTGFDFVVFNFPHTGTDAGLEESIAENQELLRGFLASVARGSGLRGEVHVALSGRYPYTAWNAAGQTPPSLRWVASVRFDPALYPGYKHQATSLTGKDTRFDMERCVTHVWQRKAGQPTKPLEGGAAPKAGAVPVNANGGETAAKKKSASVKAPQAEAGGGAAEKKKRKKKKSAGQSGEAQPQQKKKPKTG